MRVTGLENSCPRCGKRFGTDVKFECPFCGELILIGAQKCPVCRVDLSGLSDKAKPQTVEKSIDQLLNNLIEIESAQVKKEDKRFCCPNCAWLLDGTETKCPKCGQILTGKLGLQCPICGTSVEKGLRECPKCGIALKKLIEEARPMVSFFPMPEVRSVTELEEFANSHACPVCGAISPKGVQECPRCSASLVEEKPADAQKEPTKAQRADEALLTLTEIEKTVQKPLRERKLKPKSEKVTTVPVKAQTSAPGLSNGIGQVNGRSKINGLGMVNGRSKINGTGAVNGKSLVNGTGISNGLRARTRDGAAKRTIFLTHWQFLAVLVAIIVVIPTFVILSYSKTSDHFAVDGKFGDWEDTTTYGTRIQSASSRTNITEWAVGSQSKDLFFYFRTQSPMMSSYEADSFYLFVDSDGSNSTGYDMESIGADYMLQLTGWDNTVNSTSVSEYSSSSDQYNWSAWISIGSLSYSTDGVRLEGNAMMPVALGQTAKFMLVSKDSLERSSVSYAAPLTGGVLIVQQTPSADVATDGLVQKAGSVEMLAIRFTCEGQGGHVDQVSPTLVGTSSAAQIDSFSLNEGEEHLITVTIDTSSAIDGQFVSTKILASSIVSSFASVDIIGDGASAYVGSSPATIAIDGAFADWDGKLSIDQDSIPVTNAGVDIDEVGNVSTIDNSYFYVSVEGEMCSGTFVPAMVIRPSGTGGGGGVVIQKRHTAEDILRIYIDSDRSNSTGERIALNSKLIGADQMIEVRGLFGRITSSNEFNYSSGDWIQVVDAVKAAKDSKRIEIGVSAASIGGSSDLDFIVETTTWKGRSDLATFDPSSTRAITKRWIVDPSTTSQWATAMSYQRKVFHDGTNYWSFYFDGSSTVHKYSTDDGVSWTSRGSVFKTSGVNETSVWYDSATNTIYAVGDTSTASINVYLQVGTVNPASHTILWAASDSTLATSSNALAGKNTYICKDANGYLWVLSSNFSQAQPPRYQLSAFRSASINSTASWVFSGEMLGASGVGDNLKGTIVPAGSGSDVWAVYTYSGTVASRKYTGTWQNPQTVIYTGGGSASNTDNSPPSVVVDGKGVVHVVYGTGRKTSQNSIPSIEYSYNNTGATTFVASVDLDVFIAGDVGDYYPAISLESTANNLYVFWLQSDTSLVPKTLVGRLCVSGSWSNLTFESQTTYAKQYLTSIYSVSGEFKICWQWTQNITSPIHVLFDHTIPEFSDITLPILGFIMILAVYRQRSRGKGEESG